MERLRICRSCRCEIDNKCHDVGSAESPCACADKSCNDKCVSQSGVSACNHKTPNDCPSLTAANDVRTFVEVLSNTAGASSASSSACAAHSTCKDLAGDCCPTQDGKMLDCCKASALVKASA